MTKINLSFKSNYHLNLLDELNSSKRFYYPNSDIKGGENGCILEIISERESSWTGVFAYGKISSKGISGIYTMPNPDKFCVISRGSGYIVSAKDPKNWEEIKSIPVLGVFPIKSQNIIIFADYSDLTAYNEQGILWSTRVTLDDFKVDQVSDTTLKGNFWSERDESYNVFQIDVLTGNKT